MSFLELDSNDKDQLPKAHIVNLTKGSRTEVQGDDEKDRGYFETMMDPSAEESDESIDSFVKRTEEEYIHQSKKKGPHVHGSEEDSSCHTDDKEDSSCTSDEVDKMHKVASSKFKATRLQLKDISSEPSLDDGDDTEANEAVSSDEDYMMVSVGGGDSAMPVEEQVEETVVDDTSGDGNFVVAGEEEDSDMVDNGADVMVGDGDDGMIGGEEEEDLMAGEKQDSLMERGKDGLMETEKKDSTSNLIDVEQVAGYEMVSAEADPLAFEEGEREGLMSDKGERGEEVITGKNVTLGENESSGSLLNTFPPQERKHNVEEKVRSVENKNDRENIEDKIENSFGFDDSEEDVLGSNINVHVDTHDYEERGEHAKPVEKPVNNESVDTKTKTSEVTTSSLSTNTGGGSVDVQGASPSKKAKVEFQDSSPTKTTKEDVEKNLEPLDRGKDNTIKVRILKVQNKQGSASNILVYSGKESKVGSSSEVSESRANEGQNKRGNIVIGKTLGGIQVGKKSENKEFRGSELKVIGGIIKKIERSPQGSQGVVKQAELNKTNSVERAEDLIKNKTQNKDAVSKTGETTVGPKVQRTDGTRTSQKPGGETQTSGTGKPGTSVQEPRRNVSVQKKQHTNIEQVKRKLEEIMEISKAEEEAAVAELQKMKKEKEDVLDKITAEMEKLKGILARGKEKQGE